MHSELERCAEALGIPEFFDHQVEAFEAILAQDRKAACLYFPTGQGKTATSLVMMRLLGQTEVLVIAPPSTQRDWAAQGDRLGIKVTAISHAKFRQKSFSVRSPDTAIIVDEFHLLGGRTSEGWKKFDRRIAPHLRAPFIICSATPSYNDLGRVYAVHHVLDPQGAKGGFAAYQLEHCHLEVAYRGLPRVVGFKEHENAAEFLASLPSVYYMEDRTRYSITDHPFQVPVPSEWLQFNYDSRTRLLMHSGMTRRVSWANLHYLTGRGELRSQVGRWLTAHTPKQGAPSLVYCDKTTIAKAAYEYLALLYPRVELITGETSKARKDEVVTAFREGKVDVLVATATLATGTDGFDKVCDTMLILQDTQDDSLRRQLVGRILPRGRTAANKRTYFHRLVLPPVPK